MEPPSPSAAAAKLVAAAVELQPTDGANSDGPSSRPNEVAELKAVPLEDSPERQAGPSAEIVQQRKPTPDRWTVVAYVACVVSGKAIPTLPACVASTTDEVP
eukprot:scaffold1911_cov397-Prasinococcus_capsulatus_cf.AAC.27